MPFSPILPHDFLMGFDMQHTIFALLRITFNETKNPENTVISNILENGNSSGVYTF